ncbi:hypothetical protein [Pelagibacterium lentulum]|uniref:Uncharacterized protein n=1 Tax=Pelagibacterium lentulum TaxID=2029865 RepID=A0A916RD98_9HYPH|nr:hypothetical protein [Pelagibacterium lentulum]GGA51455.1 hypothetical protein GCM10011499_21870 [Pelagibacterium lentulum]
MHDGKAKVGYEIRDIILMFKALEAAVSSLKFHGFDVESAEMSEMPWVATFKGPQVFEAAL